MTALMEHYTKRYTVWEDFATVGDFSAASGTLSADSTYTKNGANSLKVVTASGARSIIKKTIDEVMVTRNQLYLNIYLPGDPATTLDYIEIQFTTAADYLSTTNFRKQFSQQSFSDLLQPGWNTIAIIPGVTSPRNIGWATTGTIAWTEAMKTLILMVMPKTGQVATVIFDSIYVEPMRVPMAFISFDDLDDSLYSAAYPLLKEKGIKGTFYANKNFTDAAGYVTTAQLATMAADGFVIANHGTAHTTNYASAAYAAILADIQTCRDWLIGLGYDKGAYHVAYPGGNFGIDARLAMTALGMKTGRNTSAAQCYPVGLKWDSVCSYTIGTATSLATAKGYVDAAIAAGSTVGLLFHIIDNSGGVTAWTAANLGALLDYINERKLKTVTIDELYEGRLNPRYNSKSLSRAIS